MSEKSILASILSIGTELTSGIVQDLHGKTISAALTSLGISVDRIVCLPDRQPLIEAELNAALSTSDVVMLTGGLGPTSDDLTREAVAAVSGRPLEFRQECWQAILDRFPGRTIPETNKKQACIPAGFIHLPNRRGTAAGFWGKISESIVTALPGPPGELSDMFTGEILPRLEEIYGKNQEALQWGTSFLLPESTLERALQECSDGTVHWGTRTEYLRIVFNLKGGTEEAGSRIFDRLRKKMGAFRIRSGVVDASKLLIETLRGTEETIAGAESCTGGLIAKLITDVPGSSEVFWGSFITYANEAKTGIGVPGELIEKHGAVSLEVVEAMAEAVLKRSGADIGFAVSGIAGPDGGTEEKPVGTVWLTVKRKGGALPFTRRIQCPGSRDSVRKRAAAAVLLLAEAVVKNREILDSDWNWEYI